MVVLTWTQLGRIGGTSPLVTLPDVPFTLAPFTLALAPRMYRVYGKKNIKLEPVPLKGASLDPR